MDLKKYIGNQIKTFRKSAGFTQDELAKRLNTTKQTISRYEKGDRKANQDMLFELCDIFGVSIDDFFPSQNETLQSPTTSPIQTIYDQLHQPRKAKVLTYAERQLEEQNEEETKGNEVSEVIQLYGYDYYDHPASAGTGQYLNDVRVERIELPVDIDADFVIPIKGDSMEPDYHDGDLVFIQTSVDLNNGVIGVFNYNGDAYIKQLVIDKEQAYLHSLNPAYKDMPITPETDFRIIGEVVDLYREG
ncbi:TPA: helix-turn-helix domain-containing protein [Streptococcus pneumoniae]|uniref:helix-turn-helix domain-containing protein n=1 Tax=Streptococcus oralis TaxID=1303 RepID=UPI00200085CE|nr:S24 family peptidase [Streptococcus oralis]HEV5657689.1 helix-turn-helix domain-containing protein [Streptococcus pneumoniae]